MTTETLVLAPAASPWRTVWFSPRRTIRAVIDAIDRPSIVPVVALACVSAVVEATVFPEGEWVLSRAVAAAVFGMLQMVFGVLIGPFILAFTGRLFGGDADPADLRHAVAWSYAPGIVAGGVILLPLMLFGPEAVLADAGTMGLVPLLAWLLASLLSVGCIWWGVAMLVVMVAEINRFSVPRAVATVVLPLVPVFLGWLRALFS